MSRRKDIDRAIGNLMKWASRPEWAERRQAVFDEHLHGTAARVDLEVAEMLEGLEKTGHFPMVMGMALEDFASRPAAGAAPNVVDDYLKRRGWRESPLGRRYLAQLRDSVLSLYEVLDVEPGRSVVVRDLIRGGRAVRVHEKLGSEQLVRWDRLAARVIDLGGRPGFTGGLMPFEREPADALLRLFERGPAEVRKWMKARAADPEGSRDAPDAPESVTALLRERCASFTEIWLTDLVSQQDAPMPELVNRDGDALLFGEVRFRAEREAHRAIETALDAAEGWERGAENERVWTWVDDAKPKNPPTLGRSVSAQTEDGRPILGMAELCDDALVFTSNSRERTERGQDVLESLLGAHVARPVTSFQSPQALLASNDGADAVPAGADTPAELDDETQRLAIGQFKDRHYRSVLDEPVPALGGKSPRACARSKRDRAKVVAWLKDIENHELRAAARRDPGAYDVGWIWEELGLGEFRS